MFLRQALAAVRRIDRALKEAQDTDLDLLGLTVTELPVTYVELPKPKPYRSSDEAFARTYEDPSYY